jgi:hypothetical protein
MQIPNGLTQAQVDADALKASGDSVVASRQAWYHTVGDGIWFKQQRGEVPEGTWETAVAVMKSDNPYPDGYTSPTAAMVAKASVKRVSL